MDHPITMFTLFHTLINRNYLQKFRLLKHAQHAANRLELVVVI